jgi:transposase-like protein
MNFFDFMTKFATEEKFVGYFIKLRYKGKPVCHHCGGVRTYARKDSIKKFDCNDCGSTFSVFAGTIFEKSSTDLRKWAYGIHLFLNAKKGISSYQLEREIKVTHKTAWRMLQHIRKAMGNHGELESFSAIVEMDETYVGGKPRKENKRSEGNKNKRGRGTSKTPVIGVVDRTEKRVHAKVALPNKEGQKLTGKQLLDVLKEVSKGVTTVITDEFSGYKPLSKDSNYVHLKVDHNVMFALGDIHTNGIESFWAILKRGVYGIYHQVSPKYLQRYVDEFCFRFNNRDIDKSFTRLILQGASC